MSQEQKKQEEQRLNVTEEQMDQAVENAMKQVEEEGAADALDINIYKCSSSA